MADSDKDEKTEEPTQARRDEFRKRGQVAQSKEFATALMLMVTLLVMWLLGKYFLEQISVLFSFFMGSGFRTELSPENWQESLKFAALHVLKLGGPILLLLWFMSFASTIVQTGFLTNEEALQLKWERLDPIEGFKKIFSLRNGMEGLKALLKLVFVGAVVYFILRNEVSAIPHVIGYSVAQILGYMSELTIRLVGVVLTIMVGLAALDYFFQRWDLEKQMMMTKQEVKEEHKSREGDPLIKARIRRIQREMSQKRMMEDVPKADVIITNPTHIAVALKYDDNMIAPTIVAMGAGVIAERIKEIAREFKVPVVENKPLARTIYKTLEIGQAIPKELYMAVAEVLSYVFRLKKRGSV